MPDMPVEPSGGPHYSSDMEARLAVLEQIAAATKAALIDIRAEMRETRDEMRHEMREMRSELRSEFRSEIGGLRNELRADYRWLMGLMLAAAGGILAVMAHGFHWF
ncbi:MAG: hypothetical protein ACREF3_12395 [Acetobacteraceae bacterium]